MVYFIDTVGEKSGLESFDENLVKLFVSNGIKCGIISNFSSKNCSKVFYNFYKNISFAKKILFFVISYLNYLKFIFCHQKSIFVYSCFGLRFVDIIFNLPFSLLGNFFVLVNDVQSLNTMDGLSLLQRIFYKYFIRNIIVFSKSARDELYSLGFRGRIFIIPWPAYSFDKSFDDANIAPEVRDSVNHSKINLLFFGGIKKSKGLDLVINALNELNPHELNRLKLIIAGQNINKAFVPIENMISNNVDLSLIIRYINNDELGYLFNNADYVLLPYEKIYQSAILNLAFYYNKPVISSDLPYFNEIYEKVKYGFIFKNGSKEDLKNTFLCLPKKFNFNSEDFLNQQENCLEEDLRLLLKNA
ncbi:MAG: glycosyltransferase [Candidatus Omnitrophica bacterium]|nr:glycosyltransferase [Candidatus Omnitrophota bacterium]